MGRYRNVSLSVVRRLPRYYRFIGDLLEEGVHRISSKELAQKMKLTASQIRQDLNCFGGFGQQGYGYNVDALYTEIGKILGLDTGQKAILLGAGNLGMALVKHIIFEQRGFSLVGIFDVSESVVGKEVRNLIVRHIDTLEDFCRQHNPSTAIICVPNQAILELAQRLIDNGIKGFLNFTDIDLSLHYPDIAVQNVHFEDSLMTLCYLVNELEDTGHQVDGAELIDNPAFPKKY